MHMATAEPDTLAGWVWPFEEDGGWVGNLSLAVVDTLDYATLDVRLTDDEDEG